MLKDVAEEDGDIVEEEIIKFQAADVVNFPGDEDVLSQSSSSSSEEQETSLIRDSSEQIVIVTIDSNIGSDSFVGFTAHLSPEIEKPNAIEAQLVLSESSSSPARCNDKGSASIERVVMSLVDSSADVDSPTVSVEAAPQNLSAMASPLKLQFNPFL